MQLLRYQLPDRVTGLLSEAQGAYSDLEEALRRSDDLVAARAETQTGETLQTPVRSQVGALLTDLTRVAGQQAFFDLTTAHAGLRGDDLIAARLSTTERAVRREQPMPAPGLGRKCHDRHSEGER